MTVAQDKTILLTSFKEQARRSASLVPGNLLLQGGRRTKCKTRVGNLSPHIGTLSSSVSLSAFAVSIALGGGLLMAPIAAAQTVTLSGEQTSTQTLTGAPLVVQTNNTLGIVTTSGSALVLTGTNGTSLNDSNASTITGATDGINARNDGTGAMSVTLTGAVTGTASRGIYARNRGTDLTISTAAVSGGTDGIVSYNDRGTLSVTSSGAVTGTSGFGIRAFNGGTDLTISAASISGGTFGILARNVGTGALSVTSTGAVSGGTYGINARN